MWSALLVDLDCFCRVLRGQASPIGKPFTVVRSCGQMGMRRVCRTSQKMRISRFEESPAVFSM